MGNFDHDNSIASMLEESRACVTRVRPPFPEWMRELKLLPTPERLRGQFKRRSRGMSEEERLRAEWLYLKRCVNFNLTIKRSLTFYPPFRRLGQPLMAVSPASSLMLSL